MCLIHKKEFLETIKEVDSENNLPLRFFSTFPIKLRNTLKEKVCNKNFCSLRQWHKITKIKPVPFKVIHNLPMFIWGQFSIDVTVKHQSLPISNPSTPHLMHWKLLSLLNLKSKIHEGRILKNLKDSKRFINILENSKMFKKILK